MQVVEERKYQEAVSYSMSKAAEASATADASAFKGVKPELPVDTWVHQQLVEARERERKRYR